MTKYITKKNIFHYLSLIAVLTALDLLSKHIIFSYLSNVPNNKIELLPIFNLVTVWNRGVSFGMFSDLTYAPIILTIVALAITIFLFIWLLTAESKYVAIALSLVLSGAFGNIIDRIMNGAVADFLDFHIGIHHWPAFNLADSFITIGALLLIFEEFILYIKKWKKK